MFAVRYLMIRRVFLSVLSRARTHVCGKSCVRASPTYTTHETVLHILVQQSCMCLVLFVEQFDEEDVFNELTALFFSCTIEQPDEDDEDEDGDTDGNEDADSGGECDLLCVRRV